MKRSRFILPIIANLLFWSCQEGKTTSEPESPTTIDTAVAPAVPLKSGPQVIHMPDGGRMQGMMEAGKRTGVWTSHFPNGLVRSRSTYLDGLEEGATAVFFENGMTYYTGSYLHGKAFGEWVFFEQNGQELKRVQYDSTGVVIK